MYHQLCVLGIPLGGERKVDRVPTNFFSITDTRLGFLIVEWDLTGRIALRSVQCSAVQAVAGVQWWCCMCVGRPPADPRPFGPFIPYYLS